MRRSNSDVSIKIFHNPSEILQSFFDDTQRQRQVYRMILAGIMRQALGRPFQSFLLF